MKVRDVLQQLANGGRLSRVERFALEALLSTRSAVLEASIVEGPPPREVPRASARRMPRVALPRQDATRGREG